MISNPPTTTPGSPATLRPAAPALLSRGRHADPGDGACAMELASALAGEPWSDHPACVHPVLAAVARAVNDGTGEAGRARLAALVPTMIGTGGSGASLLAGCARVVLCCAGAALDHAGAEEPEMTWARETALAVLARQHGGSGGSATARLSVALLDRAGLLGVIYPDRAARQAVLAVALVRVPASAENDRRLIRLLSDCIACMPKPADTVRRCRGGAGRPVPPRPARARSRRARSAAPR